MRTRANVLKALRANALGALVVGVTAMARTYAKWRKAGRDGRRHSFEGSLAALKSSDHVNLSTYRGNGEVITTTVWFVLVDGRVYVTTPPRSAKMKRIRNDPRVLLTPSNAWGSPRGESITGIARILEDGEAPEQAGQTLRREYGLGLALFHLFGRRGIGRITLEINPAGREAA